MPSPPKKRSAIAHIHTLHAFVGPIRSVRSPGRASRPTDFCRRCGTRWWVSLGIFLRTWCEDDTISYINSSRACAHDTDVFMSAVYRLDEMEDLCGRRRSCNAVCTHANRSEERSDATICTLFTVTGRETRQRVFYRRKQIKWLCCFDFYLPVSMCTRISLCTNTIRRVFNARTTWLLAYYQQWRICDSEKTVGTIFGRIRIEYVFIPSIIILKKKRQRNGWRYSHSWQVRCYNAETTASF